MLDFWFPEPVEVDMDGTDDGDLKVAPAVRRAGGDKHMDIPESVSGSDAYMESPDILGDIPVEPVSDNPPCVNPAHLRPTTIGDNTRRGISPAAFLAALHSSARAEVVHA